MLQPQFYSAWAQVMLKQVHAGKQGILTPTQPSEILEILTALYVQKWLLYDQYVQGMVNSPECLIREKLEVRQCGVFIGSVHDRNKHTHNCPLSSMANINNRMRTHASECCVDWCTM